MTDLPSANDRPIAPIERAEGGWSYRMEYIDSPPHVLVTLAGIAENSAVEWYYRDIVDIMDRLVGVGKPFLPIIFDMSKIEIGRVSLPVIWKSPGQVPRRVKQIIVVYSSERKGILESFVTTLAGLFPGMSVADSLDEAHARLITHT